ncbi:sensor domain-containing diguanylate cyclase [Aurantivibrio infirmus]
MKLLTLVFFCWLALLQATVGYAQENMVIIDPNLASVKVNKPERLLVTKDHTPDEIESLYGEKWDANLGPSLRSLDEEARHWFRFDAVYNGEGAIDRWVVIAWPLLDHVQMYTYDHEFDTWRTLRPSGQDYPLSARYVENRNFIFPLHLEKDQHKTVYISVRSKNLVAVPISIWSRVEYIEQNQLDLVLLGVFFGCLIIMFFYNMCLYFFVRDESYFYYSFYIGAAILYQLSLTGLGSYYLWENSTWLKKNSFEFFANLTFLCVVFFVRQFLNLKSYKGWLIRANNALLIFWSVFLVVNLFDSGVWSRVTLAWGSLVTCFVGLVMCVYLWNRDKYRARIYTYASLVVAAGTVIFVLAIVGSLPLNVFTLYSQMVGLVIEFTLLSLALAHIINEEKKKADDAQTEALRLAQRVSEERRERLRAQMETLDIQQQLNEDLEVHVNERTEQLKEAMANLELANAELTKLSVTDSLSKVHNRRHFDDTLISEYKRAHRANQSLAVILVDIDYFKNINDHYGHSVGDECIELVAEVLDGLVHRPGDMFARYGGEEFVYVLPGSDEASALKLANAARLAVEKIHYTCGDELVPLTISAGVAAWVPSVENAYKELLNAADTALYRAKEAGRNCVMGSQEIDSIIRAQ